MCPHVHIILLEPPLQSIVQYIVSHIYGFRDEGPSPTSPTGHGGKANGLQSLSRMLSKVEGSVAPITSGLRPSSDDSVSRAVKKAAEAGRKTKAARAKTHRKKAGPPTRGIYVHIW